MMLEYDLRAYLLTVETIAAVVGTQIYGLYRPQGPRPLPELLITRTQTTRQDKFCGVDLLVNTDVQIDVYGMNPEQSLDLARVVRLALKNFSGAMGATPVQKVFLVNEFPALDPEPGTVRIVQVYNFWYEED